MSDAMIALSPRDFELLSIDAEARRICKDIARLRNAEPHQDDYYAARAVLRQQAYLRAIKPVMDVIALRMACTMPVIRWRYEPGNCVVETDWPEAFPTKDEQVFIDSMFERYSK